MYLRDDPANPQHMDDADRVGFHYSAERSRRFSIVMTEESAEPLPPDDPA